MDTHQSDPKSRRFGSNWLARDDDSKRWKCCDEAAVALLDRKHDVDLMVQDSKRFADSGGWGYGAFEYNAATNTFAPATLKDKPRRETMPSAGSRATPE
jgi:hypothetical protein